MGRTTDQHMNFPGPGGTNGLNPGAAGGSPDDGIFDDDHPFSFQDRADRIEFDPDPEIPHTLGGLDKGPSHIMIADDPHFKRDMGSLGKTQGGVIPGIREGHGQIRLGLKFLGQHLSQALPDLINILPENITVRPGKIDKFKDAKGLSDFTEPA